MTPNPQSENIKIDNSTKTVYFYYDKAGKPVFKAKEIFKKTARILIYPYSANPLNDEITRRRIKSLEFLGWASLESLPKYFRKEKKKKQQVFYGIYSPPLKKLLDPIYRKYPKVEKLILSLNHKTKFTHGTITINWDEMETLVRNLQRELNYHDRLKKLFIKNELTTLNRNFRKEKVEIQQNELRNFLERFDSFEKISDKDVESLSGILDRLPKSKISVTNNFIKTKEKINIAYLETIIHSYEKLLKSTGDSEKAWQTFFEQHSWIFSHLFPYEVILKQREAYVGGKTISNKDGKLVDFLMSHGFEDNYALIEIKTHKKPLLKNTAYRGDDVFAMSDELSGGINQCIDQKDTFIKDYGKEYKLFDPKTILLIGMKPDLTVHQKKCFELLRANQKSVDIVTYDEVLLKLKTLLKIMTS